MLQALDFLQEMQIILPFQFGATSSAESAHFTFNDKAQCELNEYLMTSRVSHAPVCTSSGLK